MAAPGRAEYAVVDTVLSSNLLSAHLAGIGLVRQCLAIHHRDWDGQPSDRERAQLQRMYEAYLRLNGGSAYGLVFALVQTAARMTASFCHELDLDEHDILARVQADFARDLDLLN